MEYKTYPKRKKYMFSLGTFLRNRLLVYYEGYNCIVSWESKELLRFIDRSLCVLLVLKVWSGGVCVCLTRFLSCGCPGSCRPGCRCSPSPVFCVFRIGQCGWCQPHGWFDGRPPPTPFQDSCPLPSSGVAFDTFSFSRVTWIQYSQWRIVAFVHAWCTILDGLRSTMLHLGVWGGGQRWNWLLIIQSVGTYRWSVKRIAAIRVRAHDQMSAL